MTAYLQCQKSVVVPRLPDLISFDFYLWKLTKINFIKKNARTQGEVRNNTCSEISAPSGKKSRELRTNCSASILNASDQEGKIFSTYE